MYFHLLPVRLQPRGCGWREGTCRPIPCSEQLPYNDRYIHPESVIIFESLAATLPDVEVCAEWLGAECGALRFNAVQLVFVALERRLINEAEKLYSGSLGKHSQGIRLIHLVQIVY
jgi:hypothetical protein